MNPPPWCDFHGRPRLSEEQVLHKSLLQAAICAVFFGQAPSEAATAVPNKTAPPPHATDSEPGPYDQEQRERMALSGVDLRSFSMGSNSMSPVLKEGEIVLTKSIKGHLISYGDVIVFRRPTQNKSDYVKRVIGLPGDTIQVKARVVYINRSPVTLKRIADHSEELAPGLRIDTFQYIETLPNGKSHLIIEFKRKGEDVENTGQYTVPQGNYFVLGDNRDNSLDSRFVDLFGYVPARNIGYLVRWVMRPLPQEIDSGASK